VVVVAGAPSVGMHPVPSDWMLSNTQTLQEIEDANPDTRRYHLFQIRIVGGSDDVIVWYLFGSVVNDDEAIGKDGQVKRQHDLEFYASERDNDQVAAPAASHVSGAEQPNDAAARNSGSAQDAAMEVE
jgi:hypothetical protein